MGIATPGLKLYCISTCSPEERQLERLPILDQKDKYSEQERRVKVFVTILWVPLHYGVDTIEDADSLADKGTKLKHKDIPITHDIARAGIKKQK